MNNKIKDLEYIVDEAELAVLALTSSLVNETIGIMVLQKRWLDVSNKAKRLLELETREGTY